MTLVPEKKFLKIRDKGAKRSRCGSRALEAGTQPGRQPFDAQCRVHHGLKGLQTMIERFILSLIHIYRARARIRNAPRVPDIRNRACQKRKIGRRTGSFSSDHVRTFPGMNGRSGTAPRLSRKSEETQKGTGFLPVPQVTDIFSEKTLGLQFEIFPAHTSMPGNMEPGKRIPGGEPLP